ncbi:SRPBCC family protein [Rhizobium halophytocola]|uniref:Uncharacterized protein YndB with AHSA1/START domain n=1 Tax=Rhizobium halophytocola TaxID=735519 RepID=A0ABS4DTN8_9HYPH|nr:SRPBCC domain-containing protein [Rhizobium halophytocola]MBP1849037.1 uncharacterized protein YndB with AHSA1/START domain [Rhizobium halophytocola]
MSDAEVETLSVVVEREFAHSPDKIWRALTQPQLIAEWLMKNEFAPVVGHAFTLRAEWGSVTCRVETVEPNRRLAYSWDAKGLDSTVTWTLTPTETGTHLRMEQVGFRPERPQFFEGARAGWPRFLDNLEQVLSKLD